MNIQRLGVMMCFLIGMFHVQAVCRASSLVQCHDGDSLIDAVYWIASSNELVIFAEPSQFMHIIVDRDSLFNTFGVPHQVLASATGLDVRIVGFGEDNKVLIDQLLSGESETPGLPFEIGTTIGGSDLEFVYIVVQIKIHDGILGPLPGGGLPGSGSDPCCGTIDINCDGVVDLDDFEYWLDLILNGDPAGDLNGDGCVGAGDIDILLEIFGPLLDPDPFGPGPGPGIYPSFPFGPNGGCDPDPFGFEEHAPIHETPPDDLIISIGLGD